MVLCNGAPVHWRSNKQPVASVSSAPAGVYALAEAAKDVQLNAWSAQEMWIPCDTPLEIMVDNAATITFQNKMNPDSKLKGAYDLRRAWVKELQDSSCIKAVKVDTLDNIADVLTKCHRKALYNNLIGLPLQQAQALAVAHGAAAHSPPQVQVVLSCGG